MTVRLHKVTLFVVEPDGFENPLDQLRGDCYHNSFARIVETQSVSFDRDWDDDDPLNQTTNLKNRALLEAWVQGMPKVDEIEK